MKKLLQINPVIRISTSTGRIMQEIGELAIANGWESYIAYSKGRDGIKPCKSKIIPIGSKLSVFWHGLITRIFDRHGLASCYATKDFIRKIEKIQPDIIHIHNIHGYFLNYKLLFDYFSKRNIPIVWTIHDCWLYTGHCYYYSFINCNKWQDMCMRCPQKNKFPASYLFDRSAKNYRDKKIAFNSINNLLTIVPVSNWIGNEMKKSFFKNADFKVIHNGIDTDVFSIKNTENIKIKYNLFGKIVILGVASIWSKEKGFYDFIKLSELISDNELIILVGVSEDQKKMLPNNIIGIHRTENINQLAELYSVADVFVNPTWQDNYPTVNLEAISCGTPIVTYRTGGSVEAVTDDTGIIVEKGDINALLNSIRKIETIGKGHFQLLCRRYAVVNFKKNDRYRDYIDLYDSMLK